jgi:hypothetical protein
VSSYYRQGHRFDARTAQMVDALTDEFGAFDIMQGSYSDGGQSAGTHSNGGAIDVSDRGMTSARRNTFVAEARRIGWAMWWRPTRAGVWSSHFHGIAIQPGGKNDRGVLSQSAHNQVIDYYEGRDGLAGNGPDPHRGLGIKPITFEQYQEDDVALSEADKDFLRALHQGDRDVMKSFAVKNAEQHTGIRLAIAGIDADLPDAGTIAAAVIKGVGTDIAKKVADEIAARLNQ